MASAPPLLFDRALVRRRLQIADIRMRRDPSQGADFLRRRAAEDLVERLEAIMRRFPRAVDLGSRDAAFGRALQKSPAWEKVGDPVAMTPIFRPGSEAQVVGDEEALPFAPESFDLATSVLALHLTNDLVGALVQARRILKPDGLFLGAVFTGATLTELRQSLLEAEAEVTGAAAPRVAPFADGPDLAALAQRAGFALPVVDIDRMCVRYGHPLDLIADLRAMAETNPLLGQAKRRLTRQVMARGIAIYQERFSDADGRVRATFEISTLTGWAPHPNQQQPLRPGQGRVRLADALGVTEHKLSSPRDPPPAPQG